MDRDEAEHEVGELADEVFELLGEPEGISFAVDWCDAGCLQVTAANDEDGIFGALDARDFERLSWKLEETAPEQRVAALTLEMTDF